MDVRTRQQGGMSAKCPFAASGLDPGVMFPGAEVGFTAATPPLRIRTCRA